jgi:4-amino-4-deoxy-L-arabinose transferase-like glycosyltransferase
MEIVSWLKKNWLLIVVLVVLLATRLVYLFLLHPPLIWVDGSQYDELGWSLAQNGTYSMGGEPFAGREPGYPLFFLAPLYLLFGHNIFAIQVFQLILSLIIGYLVYWMGKHYFSETVGLLAAGFFALYPPFIAYSSEILTEVPFTFLIILAMFFILRGWEKKKTALFLVAGFLIGMATLTRFIAAFLPLFLLPVFYWFSKDWKKSLRYSFLMIAIVLAMISPWLWRNYSMYHTFIFGRLGGGEIYWSGSYIPWQGEWKGMVPPMDELERGLTPLEVEQKMKKLAWQNITENPLGVLAMWLKKPGRMFLKSEFNTVLERDNGFTRLLKNMGGWAPSLLKGLLLAVNALILALGATGVWFAYKINKFFTGLALTVVLYFLLFYLPLNPDSRYKLPLLPYIFVFASVAIFVFKAKITGLLKRKIGV